MVSMVSAVVFLINMVMKCGLGVNEEDSRNSYCKKPNQGLEGATP